MVTELCAARQPFLTYIYTLDVREAGVSAQPGMSPIEPIIKHILVGDRCQIERMCVFQHYQVDITTIIHL